VSLPISGDQAQVTTPLGANIVGTAANGSGEIRVQTFAPHLFATGDYVHIVTVTGTIIDVYSNIVVIDATHFDLPGSVWINTQTGTATDFSLTPQIQVPTDGDTASLQLSGMLSALQALASRTQALAQRQKQASSQILFVTATSTIVVPEWVTHFLILGCGGGGGGGGGMGGLDGTDLNQYSSGGGGGGAELGCVLVPKFATTKLTVTIGTGGAGGAGSAHAPVPADAVSGDQGTDTTVVYTNGSHAGQNAALFSGAPGGGGGSNEEASTAAGDAKVVFTPGGGRGPGGLFRRGLLSKRSQTGPGPQQIYNVINTAGTLSVISGAWNVRVYEDPVGQRAFSEGGASVAHVNATYANAISYEGAPSIGGQLGGARGARGTTDGSWPGGAGGGGGGGGAFGAGGDGAPSGGGSSVAGGGSGGFGFAGAANTGGGGGGGGGGGSGFTVGGDGHDGGAGGSGQVCIVFIAAP
jgi:hypothetical protein